MQQRCVFMCVYRDCVCLLLVQLDLRDLDSHGKCEIELKSMYAEEPDVSGLTIAGVIIVTVLVIEFVAVLPVVYPAASAAAATAGTAALLLLLGLLEVRPERWPAGPDRNAIHTAYQSGHH